MAVEFPLVAMFQNRLGKALPWDRLCIVDCAVEFRECIQWHPTVLSTSVFLTL